MTSFLEISTFLEILDLIDKDTLVVLDIDETVLEYTGVSNNYWYVLFNSHFQNLKDYDKAEEASEKEWKELVERSKPKHTDKEGINKLFEKINEQGSKLIFVTARTSEMRTQTVSHFEHLGLPKNALIFYDSNEKGPRLKYILELFPKLMKPKIIFVDDLDANLISMDQTFGPLVKCFKFKKFVL
jgi:predicted secreted acid phosphatase